MIARELEVQIRRLAEAEHWPVRTIATQLGVHHDVVERVLRQAGLPAVRRARPTMIEPFLPFIREQWARWPRLTASRLYRMCRARGYPGQSAHFRHCVAGHRPKPPAEAFLRLRTLPGEQAQVDWAHFGHLAIGRARRPLVGFVLVLAWSRAIFLRFFTGLQTEHFLRGHVEAFERFGGGPRVCLYDNLKSAVLERRGDAIHFAPLLLDFSAHYCFEPRPVAVARGNEKGRVERSIRFIRGDFFAARSWTNLADLNRQADAWCQGDALDRPWVEDPRRTVRDALAEEQERLLELPATPFPTDERRERAVGRTPYVRFDGNDYSVPHALVRQLVTVVASPTVVRVLHGASEVARHARSDDRRQQIEDPAHLAALVAAKRQAREHRGLDRLAHVAPETRRLFGLLADRGHNLGYAAMQLTRLLDTYGAAAFQAAVREVLARDVPHVAAVQQVLERDRAARGRPPALPLALPDDPRLRDCAVRPHDLAGYDALAAEPPAAPDPAAPDAPPPPLAPQGGLDAPSDPTPA